MHLTKPKRQVKCIFRIKRHGEKTDEKVCQKVLKKEKILVSYKKSLVRIYEILFVCRHTIDNLTATLRICVNSRTFSGRADNACTNLLGFLVHFVRTRGMAEVTESGKTTDFYIASLPHALATHGSRD